MNRKREAKYQELQSHHQRRLKPLAAKASWLLRITDWKDKPPPLLIIKQRRTADGKEQNNGQGSILKDRGFLYGESLRRCLPTVRAILSRVQDQDSQSLELHRYLSHEPITFRGNLPLDDEAGAKLALIFKLQERVKETDRVELIARRVDRFTQEEAAYWLSRISDFGDDANRWATSGMRVMLGGVAHDSAVEKMLDSLRTRY